MTSPTIAFTFLCFNLLFLTLASANYVPTNCPPPPKPVTPACPPPPAPKKPPPTPTCPPPPTPTKPPHTPKAPPTKTPVTPPKGGVCPINTLKLAACATVLPNLLDVVLGAPPKSKCCSLLNGLTDLDAAICLCTALQANILGIHLNIPVSLTVLLNYCNKAGVPSSFQCPPSTTPVTPTPSTPTPIITPPTPTPTPSTPTPVTPTPMPITPPTPSTPTPVTPTPMPVTPPTQTPITPPKGGTCPINTLKLAACANILPNLLDVVLGVPPKSQCCSIIDGLTDLDAAICLCTALEANVLGINLNIPVSLSVLLNYCNKAGVPSSFQCPPSTTPVTPTPSTPTPIITPPTPVTPTPMPITPPTPSTPTPVTPTPMPVTPPTQTPITPPKGGTCPINTLELAACANVLPNLLDVVLGVPPKSQCCSIIDGLTDLDAAICLCTALEANVLGINLNIPVSLSVLLNYCDKAGVPSSFQCPPSTTPVTPTPSTPTPIITPPTPVTPTPMPITPPTPSTPTPITPTPMPVTPPTQTPITPPKGSTCPINTLELAACANVLPNLLDVVLGVPPKSQCCSIIGGLTDLDAAICLCTALEANVLGINLDVPVSLSVLLNYCNKAGVPSSFECPST